MENDRSHFGDLVRSERHCDQIGSSISMSSFNLPVELHLERKINFSIHWVNVVGVLFFLLSFTRQIGKLKTDTEKWHVVVYRHFGHYRCRARRGRFLKNLSRKRLSDKRSARSVSSQPDQACHLSSQSEVIVSVESHRESLPKWNSFQCWWRRRSLTADWRVLFTCNDVQILASAFFWRLWPKRFYRRLTRLIAVSTCDWFVDIL